MNIFKRIYRYFSFQIDLWAMERMSSIYQEFIRGEASKNVSPAVLFFANEAADYLHESGAVNGVIAGVHSDRIDRDLVFTIRYADGKTMEEMFLARSEELKITDQILYDRSKLLIAIPECEVHGSECIPHAIEWIGESIEIRKKYQEQEEISDRMEAGLQAIDAWAKAYPLSVFPEPRDEDLKLAEKLLEAGGISYTALNAYTMRHVIKGVEKLVKDALKEPEEDISVSWVNFDKGSVLKGEFNLDPIGDRNTFISDKAAEMLMNEMSKYGGLPSKLIGIDQGSSEGDKSIIYVICGNCGAYRSVDGFIVEKCKQCGDDEYDLYRNFEDVP